MANIIITGASSGIGFEAVLDLTANKDNQVIALARSADKLRKLHEIASSLNPDGGKLYPAQFDIVYDNYTDSLVPFIQSKFDRVDILINNSETTYSTCKQTKIEHFPVKKLEVDEFLEVKLSILKVCFKDSSSNVI